MPPAWLTEVQRPPASIPATATRPAPLLFDDQHRPIDAPAGWSARRAELIARWRAFLGTIRLPRAVPALTVLEEDRPDGVIRQLVRYEAEPGLPVEAYLLRPAAEGRDRPGAVVLHATTDSSIRQPAGLDGTDDKHIGLHLARRGYVTVCPRCFLWQYGQPGKIARAVDWLRERHPGVTGMAKMLSDAVRALDILAAQADVNPARLGAIGHSLGAKETLYLAAFDERVRAGVFSEGGIGMSYSNWDAPWYLGEAIKGADFGLDHGQVLALVAPRAFLLLGGDSADGDASWPYVDAALPVWKLTGQPGAIGLFNHREGHAFPEIAQRRSYEWLDWFLRA
jgi:dienelactone hydrolase